MITRRLFLLQSTALAATVYGAPSFVKDPFSLGVASGEPSADGFVIWTRLAPDPLQGGGMEPVPVEVIWEVAEDESMRRVVKRGKTVASPTLAHSVHVELKGLRSNRPYWYRFRVGMNASPVGRAKTTPKPSDSLEQLRFAVASCQHWEAGYWTAYEHMLADNPDLVVHLGDYIYEGREGANGVRKHNSAEIVTLADYRNRHALYKSDPAIQKMHAHCPWIVTWDDHEVDNNYAAGIPEDDQARPAFLERRANAYQAYFEHMPLRLSSAPRGSGMQMYRALPFGRFAQFTMLDTRQYRTDQPCGDKFTPLCPEVFDPGATMLGQQQETWFTNTLDKSPAKWNIVGNQILLARIDTQPGEQEAMYTDHWSGYEASRDRLMKFLADRRPSNPLVITGDIHSSWVSDLKVRWKEERDPVVGTEFVGTSISSGGDGRDEQPETAAWYRENPHLKMYNGRRGYILMELTEAHCRADYRVVPFVTRPGADCTTHSSWIVENGRRGAQRG